MLCYLSSSSLSPLVQDFPVFHRIHSFVPPSCCTTGSWLKQHLVTFGLAHSPHSGPSVGALGIGVGSYAGPPFCPLLVLPQWVEKPKLLCLVYTTFVLAPVHLLLKLLQLAKQSTLLCLFLLSPVSVYVGPQFVPLLKPHSWSKDTNFCVWFMSLIFTHGNLVLESLQMMGEKDKETKPISAGLYSI